VLAAAGCFIVILSVLISFLFTQLIQLFVYDGQIHGEMVHDDGEYLWPQQFPFDVVSVLFGDGDEIGPEEDAFDAFDAEELSRQRRHHGSLFGGELSRLSIRQHGLIGYKF
jgi:hypothetical protein